MKRMFATMVALMFAAVLSAQPQRGQGPVNPEQMADMQIEMMKKSVSLTADQESRIKAVYLADAKEMQEQMKSGNRPDREAMEKQRNQTEEKIKAVLGEEAYAKYIAERPQRFGMGEPNGQRPPEGM